MGIEVVIGAVIAATSVVTGVMQYSQARSARRERTEANNIANAQQKNEGAASRRRAIREARVRQAMIMQQSENAGLGQQGSGTLGARSVVGTNLGSQNAFAQSKSLAIDGINTRNQNAANYEFRGEAIGAFGDMFSRAVGALQTPKT